MTPLRLELEGFTCFRHSTVIDLSDLETGLFAIAGPTGAGKSTLLDAMTYALYGQTARLGSRGLDALMTPGVETMSVSLTFRTATGTFRVSRFAWQRPNRVERQTRIESLASDAGWRQLPESEKLAEANQKLIELVGLDYDGFTRAVLLPQGAFDEFLRGDAGKRRRLLTVLLGLDRVQEMQKLAGRYSRDAEVAVTALRTRLAEDYRGATPERRRELSDEREVAQRDRAERLERLGALAEELAVADDLKRSTEALRTAEREREALAAEADVLTEVQARVERARRAQGVAHLIANAATFAERFAASSGELELAAAAHAEVEVERARAKKEAASARERFERQGPEIDERLERLAEIAPLAARLVRAGGPLALAARAVAARFDESRWERIEALRERLPGYERLSENLAAGQRGLDQAGAAVKDLELELEAAQQQLSELEEHGRQSRRALDEHRRAFERLERENLAAAVRAGLEPGDPCPVCGRPIASLAAAEDVDLEGARRHLEEADRLTRALRERFVQARGGLDGLTKRLDDRRGDADRRREDVARLERELEQTLHPFTEAGLDGTDPAAALAVERERLLAALASTVVAVTGGEELDRLRRRLQHERSGLDRDSQVAERALADADRRLEGLNVNLSALARRLDELTEDRAKSEAALVAGLEHSGFADIDAARAASMPAGEVEVLEQRIATFAGRHADIERRCAELLAQQAGRSYDPEGHRAMLEQQRALRDEADTLQRRIGERTAQLERLDEMLERARGLRKELKGAEASYDTYRRLSLDLRSDNFQEFLMTRVQHDLALRASHIVRNVTEGRYDLRLDGGEYQVLDAWSGGEPRSARTLSGGETFIASLALALALSDTVAGSHALGALFLDEGFGSLDRETLDAVAGVLESLTSEGRMVGIITHVPELSERMPARLVVRKGPDGSTVYWDA